MERGDADKSDALTRLALWGGYMTGMGCETQSILASQQTVAQRQSTLS
jgi:hypothetical protein